MAINYTKTNWVNGQAPAISASNLNKIEQGIKDACDGVDELKPPTGLFVEQKALIWENASPTSSFAAQTVNLDLTDYDRLEIDYVFTASSQVFLYTSAKKDVESKFGMMVLSQTNKTGSRNATIKSNGIQFTGATYDNAADNSFAVPIRIYGIKEV